MTSRFFFRLSATVVLAASALAAHAGQTYAVIFGINDYPDVVDAQGRPMVDERGNRVDQDLRGCVNDAKGIKDMLERRYRVPSANIRIALDKEVTEAKFVENMRWLLQSAKPGDQIVFFYSGHGGQIPSTKEPDGKEEVIVLADEKLVPDDLFADIARLTREAGINSTFIFDCCYSGGMDREGRVSKLMRTFSPKAVKLSDARLAGVKATVKQAQTPATKGEFAFLFAGQEDEPTIDLAGLKDIPPHGIFTLILLAAVEDLPNGSVGDIMSLSTEVVQELVKKLDAKQNPRAEFSSAERAAKPLILP